MLTPGSRKIFYDSPLATSCSLGARYLKKSSQVDRVMSTFNSLHESGDPTFFVRRSTCFSKQESFQALIALELLDMSRLSKGEFVFGLELAL